jgi:hypothetical protein
MSFNSFTLAPLSVRSANNPQSLSFNSPSTLPQAISQPFFC